MRGLLRGRKSHRRKEAHPQAKTPLSKTHALVFQQHSNTKIVGHTTRPWVEHMRAAIDNVVRQQDLCEVARSYTWPRGGRFIRKLDSYQVVFSGKTCPITEHIDFGVKTVVVAEMFRPRRENLFISLLVKLKNRNCTAVLRSDCMTSVD